MRKLIETRFFVLLAEGVQENFNSEAYREAIHEFVDELLTLCRMETDFAALFRELEFTRIWLECWMEHASEGGVAGKKWSSSLRESRFEIRADGAGVVT